MELTDAMHYESRALRDQLRASNERVQSAKYSRGPSRGQQAPLMWAPPPSAVEIETVSVAARTRVPCKAPAHVVGIGCVCTNLPLPCQPQGSAAVNGSPEYEEMKNTLLKFEAEVGFNAPPRDRAFFSALRTLLSEVITVISHADAQMKLAAAYKWFQKYRCVFTVQLLCMQSR